MDHEIEELVLPSAYLTKQDITDARLRAKQVFTDREFLLSNGADPAKLPKVPKPEPLPKPEPPPPEFTHEEKTEALSIFLEQPDAPLAPTTSGAAKALEKLLKRFDYNLPNATNKMRQYLIFKMFELAENEDPKLAIKALEMLGKVSEIGLFSTKIEVSTTDKPTTELESELSSLLKSYSLGELNSIPAEYVEITDAELRGEYEEDDEEDEDEE